MRLKAAWRALLAIFAVTAAVGVCLVYFRSGFRPALPYLLGAAIAGVALALPGAAPAQPASRMRRGDLLAVAVLLLVMLPVFCWRVYTTPWQVNTDEVSLMSLARELVAKPGVDLFGLSGYFGCPSAAFVFFGEVAKRLGGLDLYHVRLVHGLLGVGCVLVAYGLFRTSADPVRSAGMAGLMGANHSLIAYSRMGMWSSSAVLLEILALLLVVRGLRRRSSRALFLAGIATGLAFYSYFPGRIALALCLAVLAGAWVLRPGWKPLGRAATGAATLLLGWAMVSAPVILATSRDPKQGLEYQRQQLLIYPEGQKLAESWTYTTTPRAAWLANASNGLRTFNSRLVDHGWLYENNGHGFVDPATGVLLWIGLALVVVRLVKATRWRGRAAPPDDVAGEALPNLIAMIGFLVLYLMLAFLVTKAPNYQRLLVALPFVAYLAGTGLWGLIDGMAALLRRTASGGLRPAIPLILGTLCTVGILGWNLGIFSDFTSRGVRNGHEVGSTGRFVEARKDLAHHTWVLAADKDHLYYYWGEPWWWQGWLGFFAAPDQPVKVIPPAQLADFRSPGRYTVFIARSVWATFEPSFRARHAVHSVTNILPGGRLVALEVSDAN